mgnify:CR=1 FL=1
MSLEGCSGIRSRCDRKNTRACKRKHKYSNSSNSSNRCLGSRGSPNYTTAKGISKHQHQSSCPHVQRSLLKANIIRMRFSPADSLPKCQQRLKDSAFIGHCFRALHTILNVNNHHDRRKEEGLQ